MQAPKSHPRPSTVHTRAVLPAKTTAVPFKANVPRMQVDVLKDCMIREARYRLARDPNDPRLRNLLRLTEDTKEHELVAMVLTANAQLYGSGVVCFSDVLRTTRNGLERGFQEFLCTSSDDAWFDRTDMVRKAMGMYVAVAIRGIAFYRNMPGQTDADRTIEERRQGEPETKRPFSTLGSEGDPSVPDAAKDIERLMHQYMFAATPTASQKRAGALIRKQLGTTALDWSLLPGPLSICPDTAVLDLALDAMLANIDALGSKHLIPKLVSAQHVQRSRQGALPLAYYARLVSSFGRYLRGSRLNLLACDWLNAAAWHKKPRATQTAFDTIGTWGLEGSVALVEAVLHAHLSLPGDHSVHALAVKLHVEACKWNCEQADTPPLAMLVGPAVVEGLASVVAQWDYVKSDELVAALVFLGDQGYTGSSRALVMLARQKTTSHATWSALLKLRVWAHLVVDANAWMGLTRAWPDHLLDAISRRVSLVGVENVTPELQAALDVMKRVLGPVEFASWLAFRCAATSQLRLLESELTKE